MDIFWQIVTWLQESIVFVAQTITDLTTSSFGGEQALAIILVTMLVRLVLFPINIKATIQGLANKDKMLKIKPQLEAINANANLDTQAKFQKSRKLYKKEQVSFINKTVIGNLFTQGLFGVAMFQALQTMVLKSKLAWIVSIAKPDFALAVVVGILTFFTTMLMSVGAEEVNYLIIVIPALVSFAFLLAMPSALGLYWAASNIMTFMQFLIAKKLYATALTRGKSV